MLIKIAVIVALTALAVFCIRYLTECTINLMNVARHDVLHRHCGMVFNKKDARLESDSQIILPF